ncbi:MAG: Wzz/FepE/Etk N-terminal domain-containing protein [Intrasporangium sp.]|uniref:Wzz/FepE/Etk N-terminal domain-containing protein n=1 Tax=Intrasporangium sp. TaxID=1925024 RepID=UPI003F8100C2
MSEQIVDLRSVSAILRRHARAIAVAAAVGALAGGAVTWRLPPEYRSTSVVLFPATNTGTSASGDSHTIDTQIQIALSDAVLGRAGASLGQHLSAAQVAERVDIAAPTPDVLTITATGVSPGEAEALAGAVASADVGYLREAANTLTREQRTALADRATTLKDSLEAVRTELTKTTNRLKTESPTETAGRADAAALAQLTAREADLVLQADAVQKEIASGAQAADGGSGDSTASVLQQASPAVSLPMTVRAATYSAAGGATLAIALAAILVIRGRKERVLRSRDQIADSIGVPVVASVQTRSPRSAAAWESLLAGYRPDGVEKWTLRQLVRLVTPGTSESLAGPRHGLRRAGLLAGETPRSTTVVVLILSDDVPALSVGPQLASFTASTGAETHLVVGPQPHQSANALQAACARIGPDRQLRPGLFIESHADVHFTGDLVIHLVPMDRQRPEPRLDAADGVVTLLAVSSGAASADDLARAALAADDARHPLDGIIVANPDPLDRTTGRLLPSQRANVAPLPSLMTGSHRPGELAAPALRGRQK